MAVPSLITDLSTTAASNAPAGGDAVFPDLDNFIRALSAFIAQLNTLKAPLANPTFTGTLTAPTITAPTITGAASLNVLKAGDTMTGQLAHFGAWANSLAGAGVLVKDTAGASTNRVMFSANNTAAYVYCGGSVANPPLIFGNNDGALEMARLYSDGSGFQTGPGGGVASKVRTQQWSNYYGEFGIDSAGVTFVNAVLNGTVGACEIRRNGTVTTTFAADGNMIPTLQATPPTLAANSQMVFNLTSNTNLRISVRGSDGTTRTANLTLT